MTIPQGNLPLPASPPPAPRPIRTNIIDWNSNFGLMWGSGYGGIPAVIMVGMLFSFGPPWNDWILDQRGQTTLATPYKVEETSTSVNDHALMRIRLRFNDKQGKPHQAAVETIDDDLLKPARSQQPMKIDYDPQDPSLVRVQGHHSTMLNDLGMIWVLPMLLLCFVIPGLGAFFWSIWRIVQRRSLYRNGTAALATVFEHEQSSSSQNYQNLIIARYEFTSIAGRHIGELKVLNPPPIGTRMWVIHDPSRPEQNLPA